MSEHFGTRPSVVCNAILVGLSIFKRQGSSGCLKTLKRFAGAKAKLDLVDAHIGAAGLPAMLVCYFGGTLKPAVTHQQKFNHEMDLAVICAAGNFYSREERQAGSKPSINPGIEDLMDWAALYATRAASALDGITQVYPKSHTYLRFEPGRYVGVVPIQAVRRPDIYDDAGGPTLQKLGIVHDPLDPSDLFEADNITPKSEWPAGVDGGVADL